MVRHLPLHAKARPSTPAPQPRTRSTRFWPRLHPLEDRLLLSPYVVINVNDSGPGSLREGLLEHASPITFDIGSGVQIIRPLSALPTIATAGTVIDGTTQPGYTATPLIVIDGTSVGSSANGFVLTGGNCTLKGLVIDNFSHPTQAGILIQLRGQNLITGNYIGTDATGTHAQGNNYGVFVDNNATGNNTNNVISDNLISGNGAGIELSIAARTQVVGNRIGTNAAGTQALPNSYGVDLRTHTDFNVIGGTTAADRNVISGNYTGVYVGESLDQILGNYIGTDISGTAAVPNGVGIYGTGPGSATIGGIGTASANVISGNSSDGIFAYGGVSLVEGNLIGLNAAGTAALPNYNGIDIENTNVTIGSMVAGGGNVISGNVADGILVDGATGPVQSNYIGTDPTGTAPIPNGKDGLEQLNPGGAAFLTVGGTAPGAGNLIAGNSLDGLSLTGIYDVVQGNTIGTNAAHTAALRNRYGILVNGSNNTIGGPTAAARNIIAGNTSDGIYLGTASDSNLIQDNVIAANGGYGVNIAATAAENVLLGNAIGTTPNGRLAYPNGLAGVAVFGSLNTIGGTAAGAGNVISANTGDGVLISGTGAGANLVEGNFIGTEAGGGAAQGNGGNGITVAGGAINNTIGGTAAGAGNVIAANQGDGVRLTDSATTGNLLQGNFIGTDPTGTVPLGNAGHGVAVVNAARNTVGSTRAGAGNVIAFSGADGVLVDGGSGNAIRQNSIVNSGNLGIELADGGNNDQAFPTLTGLSSDGSSTTIEGTLTSAADTTFTLEFYANNVCNPSGYGEGQTFLGTATVMTDDTGAVAFSVTLGAGVDGGQYVSATATDPGGNTSSFSACWQLPPAAAPGVAALRTAGLPGALSPTSPPAARSPAERSADALFRTLGPEAEPTPGGLAAKEPAVPMLRSAPAPGGEWSGDLPWDLPGLAGLPEIPQGTA